MNTLSRRTFIRNMSVTGGALLLGFNLAGCEDELPAVESEDDFRPDALLSISPEGTVTVLIAKAEMGQGVVTGFITVIAEELEVDPALVNFEMAPAHKAFRDPEMLLQITGASASIRVYYQQLREVGAAARTTLLQAASKVSGISIAKLSAAEGRVRSADGVYEAPYGDLVPMATTLPVADKFELKPAAEFRLIGRSDRRLDAVQKVDGTAAFGVDARPDNLVTAVLIRSPHFGGTLQEFDAAAARKMPGVIDIFQVDQAVAVVATGYWPARQAANGIVATFQPADNAIRSSADIEKAMASALDSEDFVTVREDQGESQAEEGKLVEADYRVPFLAHATMEPQNATAWVRDGRCDVWVGSQAPALARRIAAKISGLPYQDVTVHNQFLGGGFGRRTMPDCVAEAVAIALRLDRPVKLQWSREDDTRHDFYRPAMAGRLSARVTADGTVRDWQHRIVGPSISQQVYPEFGDALLPQWAPGKFVKFVSNRIASSDSASVEGAKELPYRFDGIQVLYHNLTTPVPIGFWRAVGHSHTAFVVESFVDELAHAAGEDPLAFRLRLLAEDSRQHRVLRAVSEAAGWGSAPPGRFQGVAVHESFHSVAAQIVEISVDNGQPSI
jgi:CO/xanthine dehydrogenase Mo-binding subunit